MLDKFTIKREKTKRDRQRLFDITFTLSELLYRFTVTDTLSATIQLIK